jgi:hypothetical protein
MEIKKIQCNSLSEFCQLIPLPNGVKHLSIFCKYLPSFCKHLASFPVCCPTNNCKKYQANCICAACRDVNDTELIQFLNQEAPNHRETLRQQKQSLRRFNESLNRYSFVTLLTINSICPLADATKLKYSSI